MTITDVRVHIMGEERLKAFVSVTFDNSFVVRNMKVVQGTNGLFLCMPSRKLEDGTHKDLVHPINKEFRAYLEGDILKAYQEEVAKEQNAKPSPSNSKEKSIPSSTKD